MASARNFVSRGTSVMLFFLCYIIFCTNSYSGILRGAGHMTFVVDFKVIKFIYFRIPNFIIYAKSTAAYSFVN